MAKLAFTKLGLKTNNQIKTVLFNEQEIEVKSTSDMYYRIDIPKGVNAGDVLTVTIINASGTDGTDVALGDNFIALSKFS